MNLSNFDARSHARSKLRCSELQEFRESRNPILQIQRSLRSDRLNRDNPGERSEHTSPVSRIITLFRSKPRYRPRARYSAQFLFDPSTVFLSVRSTYFLSTETHHCKSFFLRRKQFRAVESIDRISRPFRAQPLKIFPTNVTFLRLVALTEHFILRISTALVFSSFFYTFFHRAGGRSDESGNDRKTIL